MLVSAEATSVEEGEVVGVAVEAAERLTGVFGCEEAVCAW